MVRALAICGIIAGLSAGVGTSSLWAQRVDVVPTQPDQATVPIYHYRVNVVGRTITAVNYHVLGDETSVRLRGTSLLPYATGKAVVQIKRGATDIHVSVDHVNPAQRFGPEYLTYVLWAITPDGRANNLGEIQLLGQSAKMNVTTTLQNFGLIVTAEPYFGVTRPSDRVVMENYVTDDTVGATALVQAKYELLQRGQYRLHVDQSEITELPQDPRVPLDLYEAQNAVRIARWAGAEQYADSVYTRAEQQLQQAEEYQMSHAGKAPVATVAREAVQTAEDARLLTLQRRQQQQLEDAQARADSESQQAMSERQQAEQQQADADAARQQAEQQQADAQAAKQQAEVERAQAESARAAAEAQAAAAQEAAQQSQLAQQQAEQTADAARSQAAQERDRLRRQLNEVMATRDTARGLILNMSDVLFDVDQSHLTPEAKIKLAKVAGILQSYPGLQVQVQGYTDNTGTEEYNQTLSERRADSVRDFLLAQGVTADAVTAHGYGESNPVASNGTIAGRQENRRVELVVNGTTIGSSDEPMQ